MTILQKAMSFVHDAWFGGIYFENNGFNDTSVHVPLR
jgi:hypothetical protein